MISILTFSSVAVADVTLYGQVRAGMEVESKKVGNTKLYGNTRTRVVSPGSRIGFKGNEPLSGSLKVVWQVEQRLNIANGGSNQNFGTRDSFIGLEGNFGRVHLGYVNSPINEWSDNYLDPYQYSSDALGAGYWTRNSSGSDTKRRRTGVRYYTPRMGGLMGQLYVSPSNNANNNGEDGFMSVQKRDKTLYGATLDYRHQNSGFFANLVGAYAKNDARNVLQKDAFQSIAQLGVDKDKYTAGVAYQYAQNVDANNAFDANAFDNHVAATATTPASGIQTHAVSKAQEILLMGAYKVSPNLRLRASAVYGFDIEAVRTNHNTSSIAVEKVGGNGKYWQGVLGAQYILSKRTDAYSQVGHIHLGKGDEKVRTTAFGVGLRHRF